MNTQSKLTSWFLFILLALTWGSSFILMKRGLEVYDSKQVASIRMTFAFLSMLPMLPFLWKRAEVKKNWKYYLAVGLSGNLIPAFLFTKAQTGVSSATAGILNALTPLFTLLLAMVAFKKQFSRVQVMGVLIGLSGASLLILSRGSSQASSRPEFGFLIVLATMLYAVSVNVIKEFLSGQTSVIITVFAFSSIGPIAMVYLGTTDFWEVTRVHPESTKTLLYLALLGIWGTSIAVILYNNLIKQTGILFASSVTYLIPAVALLWGWLDSEGIYPAQFISIAIILAGVYLVNRRK